MEAEECAWKYIFDDGDRDNLDAGYFITGMFSIGFGLWINLAILLTNLIHDSSYRNLAYFTMVACLRRVVPVIANIPFFSFIGRDNIDSKCCEFLAFLETFLAVFEVEWLTHVCIERYVLAKYSTNGWSMQKYHYTLFQSLCLFFASLYSFPPLLGIGQYGLDFSCTSCTFDVILQGTWQRYLVVVIFVLRSIKPAIVMLMMLIWARILERKLACAQETRNQIKFTTNVIIVTMVNQICWSPIALIRGGVIFSQLLYDQPTVPVSALYIKWALWIHWVAPAVTAATLFTMDYKLRDKMFKLHYKYTTNDDNSKQNKEE